MKISQPTKFYLSPTSSLSAMIMIGQYCLPFEVKNTYGARNFNWPPFRFREGYWYGFRVWCRGCSFGRDEIRQIQIVADDQPAYYHKRKTIRKTMTDQFDTKKSLTLSMISPQGHRGVSSGLGYVKQAPSSGLLVCCHFRVTRESISNVLSLSPQRKWSRVMVFNNLNGGSKRGFSTLVLEKVQLVILVLPYLSVSGQLVLVLYCLGLSIFLRFGFGSKGSGLIGCFQSLKTIFHQSLKTIFHYQTIIPHLYGVGAAYRLQRTYVKTREIISIDPDANEISRTSARRYILVKVKINESRPDANEICRRLLHLFCCKAIIIGEKTLTGGARSIHIGIWNTDASKNTFRAYIHRAFPGEQPEITARKSWKPVYEYVSKVSNTLTIWGAEVSTPTVMRKEGRAVEKNEIPKPVFEEKKAAAANTSFG